MTNPGTLIDQPAFDEAGYVGPFPLLDQDEIDAVLRDAHATYRHVPWYKSLHVYDTACTRTALRPEILDRVTEILGPDLLLWGSQVMSKPPGEHHRWHVDVETLAWRSVNVWIALRNVTSESTIQLVPGSHRYGIPPQDIAELSGALVDGDETIAETVREFDPGGEVHTVLMEPGEFVIFDGLLWHGSRNTTGRTRSALLTQYSPTSEKVRMPATFEAPIQWKDELPPCLLVAGVDRDHHNRLVEPTPPPSKLVTLPGRMIDRLRGRE